MQVQERAYTTKEVSMVLNIGTSTLRKWCIALEENGYQFIRNDQNGRSFVEGDIVALKQFQHLVQKENFKLENASKIIVSRHKGKALPIESPHVPPVDEQERGVIERSNEMIAQLLEEVKKQSEYIEQQKEFNKELLKRLEERDKYLEERLEERDKQLMKALNESLETRRMIAATNEEENKKKGFWARLFGR